MTLPSPLLSTKIHVPPLRTNLLARPQLLARLIEGLNYALTIVSAPPGFGKTTIVGTGLSQTNYQVAWVSLEEADNEPDRFWLYLIAALQTLQPNLGTAALLSLQSVEKNSLEDVLTLLLNDLAALPQPAVLTLDDYHLIHEQTIHDGITFLIDYLPPTLRLVLTTRADPPLPLARLRARGLLYELRTDQLRFTSEETVKFLNQVMGLTLTADKVSALVERTEGWVAGLQLAALSLRGREAANYFEAFKGTHRFVIDYLVDEVLSRQSAEVQSFLLQTSILDRFNGSLCDAVTARSDGVTMLQQLERANLFIVPLDDERQWYRYHHLFAEVLQERLQQTQAERVDELNRRSADWHEHYGNMEDAVRYALTAKEFNFATRLIERMANQLWGQSQILTMLNWLHAIPDQVVRAQPRLGINLAWAYAISGRLDDVEGVLSAAEKLLPSPQDAAQVDLSWMSEEQWGISPQGVLAQIAILRSFVSRFHAEPSTAVQLARQSLTQIPPERGLMRGVALIMLGHSLILNGELPLAITTLNEAGDLTRRHHHGAGYLSAINYLGHLTYYVLGNPRRALVYFQEARLFIKETLQISFSGVELVGMGNVYRELNDLESAERYILEGQRAAELGGDFTFLRDTYVIRARLEQTRKNWSLAMEYLDRAQRVAQRSRNVHDQLLLSGWHARMLLLQGEVEAAYEWVKRSNIKPDDPLTFLHEFEYITLARVLVAKGRRNPAAPFLAEAKRLLDRLKHSAEEGQRWGRVIEILIQQTLAFQAEGSIFKAMTPLEQALKLAEPEGYVRTFVDEGEPMLTLLKQAYERGILPAYTNQLRAASEAYVKFHNPKDTAASQFHEAISEREREVLQLIAEGKSSQEIAQQLVVALSTVQWHIKNIYAKLDVHSRTQAVKKAQELKILK